MTAAAAAEWLAARLTQPDLLLAILLSSFLFFIFLRQMREVWSAGMEHITSEYTDVEVD